MTHVNHAAQAHTSDAARWKLTEFLRNAAVRGPRAGKFEAAGGSGVEDVATEIRGLAAASAQADAQESRWAKETVARINEAIGDIAVATQATSSVTPGRVRARFESAPRT